MSRTVQIDAEALLQTVANLEKYLESLRNAIGLLNERLLEVKIAREALKRINSENTSDIIVSMDKDSNLMVKLKGNIDGNPLVHLGLDIYAELPYDRAESVLAERENSITEELKRMSKEYDEKNKEYQKLQSLIYALSQQR
ncbi:prefoldin subunit alpha [Fervidicoccus fontis]|uniref:Prefoldin subunit alpha n=1 Tax=Fervidicoccus fontis TaxID=683846 RepID=A0A2J6N589_9CREN|nr:prefoldin subunit alpha [Fervidicoccus fontis]PMB75782.1 MAG: prefoldin subunit alpha [Fervidicoccus fontis]PMB76501.1 MAG: prefoldin subunit alpha [Fervidicoccus fontis]HEW63458.1 prefoldin subunit alpha [Fervidicoccus fontis]